MAELEIRFEPGKSNITPDAQSMLPSGNDIYECLADREHRLIRTILYSKPYRQVRQERLPTLRLLPRSQS